MTTLLFLNVLLLAGIAWFSLLKVVPWCALSHFRYRLWRLRDGIMDELFAGVYDDREQPQRLVKAVEFSIVAGKDLSMLNMLIAHWTNRNEEFSREDPFGLDLDSVGPSDRARLESHMDEFRFAVAKHVLLGTPSGWLTVIVVAPMILLLTLIRHLFGSGMTGGRSLIEDTKRHVQEEVELEPALALLRRRSDKYGRSVSAHV